MFGMVDGPLWFISVGHLFDILPHGSLQSLRQEQANERFFQRLQSLSLSLTSCAFVVA